MPMLSRHRRYMGAMVAGIFALLLLSNLIPDPSGRFVWRTPISNEWGLPKKAQVMAGNLKDFFHDNFGFRASLPLLRRALRADLASPDTRPIYGGTGEQFFWARDMTPEQSAGAVVRLGPVRRFVEMVGMMQKVLAPEGTRVIVAMPPNAQSVEYEGLPAWTKSLTYPVTEYDLVLKGLRALDVTAVDLRTVLRAKVPYPRYRLTDTHWNMRSAVESFNAVVAAAGHPGWALEPHTVLGEPKPLPVVGDLLHDMRMAPQVQDESETLKLQRRAGHTDPRLPHNNDALAFRSQVYPYGGKGPRVLILGDSFTFTTWTQMFLNADVSEVGWMHESQEVLGSCDFNFENVRLFKPDIVIIARVERLFPCLNGEWPVNLPEPTAKVRKTVEAAMTY